MLTSQNVMMSHVTSSNVFKGICRDLRSIFETLLVKMIELCWQGGLGSSAADCSCYAQGRVFCWYNSRTDVIAIQMYTVKRRIQLCITFVGTVLFDLEQ